MRAMNWGSAVGTRIDPMLMEPKLRGMVRLLPEIADPIQLCESVYAMLEQILQKESDRDILAALSEVVGEIIGRIPFDSPADEIRRETRRAAAACLKVLQTAYERRAVGKEGAKDGEKREDIEYWLPPHLAHLLARIEYQIPSLPEAQKGFPSATALFEAAVARRMDLVLTFFQRQNPACNRLLPPVFLCSPEFAAKLKAAAAKYIFPNMRGNRIVRVLEGSIDPRTADTDLFWERAESNLKDKLSSAWHEAWNQFRLGEDVTQVPPELMELRQALRPSSPAAYDIPDIGNREIDVFVSFFDVKKDWWPLLNAKWKVIHDFYEQEKDPRIFQQQAREGVLRDELIRQFDELPEEWSDFIVLLCYRVFPRIGIQFVEAFVHNLGWNEAARERRAPYLMRFLKQARERPEVAEAEERLESEWAQQTHQLHTYLKGFTEEEGGTAGR